MFVNNKTSKAIVFEVISGRKLKPPTWDSVQIQEVPPVFRSTCTALVGIGQKVTAAGIGSNKKDAEQRASLKILPKILSSEELFQMTTLWNETISEENKISQTIKKVATTASADIDPVSDTDDDEITGEPIGELITLCNSLKLSGPDVKESQQISAQNRPIFTVTVTVGELSTQSGRRWKKQDAKRIASFRVLRDLNAQGYKIEAKKTKEKSVDTLPSVRTSNEVSSSQEEPTESRKGNIFVKIDSEITDATSSFPVSSCLPSDSKKALAHTGKRTSSALPSSASESESERSEQNCDLTVAQQMEIEDQPDQEFLKLKRKLRKEEKELYNVLSSSSPPPMKRKYELLHAQKLTCFSPSENCLRFVKDYAHVFQHLPPNATLDEALLPKEFESNLHEYGGPLKLLEKSAKELNLKLTCNYYPLRKADSEANLLAILVLTFKNCKDFKVDFQKRHTVCGVGRDAEKAKEDAALNALKYLRCMMFSEN